MVITDGRGSTTDSLKNQVSDCNRLNSVGFSQETMREMPSYGETNLQQGSDNVLKSDSEMEQMSEKDIEVEWGMDGYAQEQKTENIATVVNKLRLCSPCQKTEKNVRTSRSRTVDNKKTRAPSHRSSRSRSRGRSIHLTQKEKKKLLEIATENADKLLGKGKMHLPPSPLKNEKPFEAKTNSDAVKELTRKKP
ncbi:hypothetical protein scyTo_0002442 [Scyliorhinus torazame]|uniref:Uncharacterized protein n=1 Tax=Scyliorhinus torazame TaxID=75743 RepID=A0A401PJF2_SCYTO|nr:hypothetical protein [Scyliorhinus torazame]